MRVSKNRFFNVLFLSKIGPFFNEVVVSLVIQILHIRAFCDTVHA